MGPPIDTTEAKKIFFHSTIKIYVLKNIAGVGRLYPWSGSSLGGGEKRILPRDLLVSQVRVE